ANAATPGFGRRELELTSHTLGGVGAGVRVVGVDRQVDAFVLADLRLADSAYAAQEERLDFMARFDPMIGATGDAGSLSSRIARLEAALTEASNRPDSEARLSAVVNE